MQRGVGLATHQAVLACGLHELSHLALALLPSTLRFLCGEVGTDRDPAPTVCHGSLICTELSPEWMSCCVKIF